MTAAVPFIDLRKQNAELKSELLTGFEAVLSEGAFASGRFVEAFEQQFAAFTGAQHCVGVSNGTDALWLALRALNIGPGDEVITVSATFFATAEAISECGATPVFVDIDEHTYTIDPSAITAAITSRTRAIIPVHLYGQMADMDSILSVARKHGLAVIEDASQAHGATYKGRPAGTLGDAGCFSFYPTKNLGALGEAGAVVTSNAELAARVKILRDHGQQKKYHHVSLGWNARMDGIQGMALSIKLRRLHAYNAARRQHAKNYNRLLRDFTGLITPRVSGHCGHVYHLYVVRIPEQRDKVLSLLAEVGIMAAVHYPVPVHLQAPYAAVTYRLPITEQLASQCLSLPLFPELTLPQIERVASGLRTALDSLAATAAA